MSSRKKRLVLIAFVLILAAVTGIFALMGGSYPADSRAQQALQSGTNVSVYEQEDTMVFSPARAEAGFVFYPGGRVEYTAYAPLMQALAQKNILCVLVQMPMDLAVLDSDAALAIPQRFPEVSDWYIGGHSLGGSMAASCAGKNPGTFRGLVLLASYATDDLTDSGLQVLSIYGTEDGVLNLQRYQENFANLPENTHEIVIKGGNHSSFGSYGLQKGDGVPAMPSGEQLALTATYIHGFIT